MAKGIRGDVHEADQPKGNGGDRGPEHLACGRRVGVDARVATDRAPGRPHPPAHDEDDQEEDDRTDAVEALILDAALVARTRHAGVGCYADGGRLDDVGRAEQDLLSP